MKINQPFTSGIPISRISRPALSVNQISQRVAGRGRPERAATIIGARPKIVIGARPKIVSVSRPRLMKCTRSQRNPLNQGIRPQLENDESSAASTAISANSRTMMT